MGGAVIVESYVWCVDCGAEGGDWLGDETAVAKWNRRTTDTPKQLELMP